MAHAAATASEHPDAGALARLGHTVRERLSHQPLLYRFPETRAEIYRLDGFLCPRECHHLMALIDDEACPSGLADGEEWPGYRTSYSGDIDTCDEIVCRLEGKLERLTGIAATCGEASQGQRYFRGQYFREHYDWFDTTQQYWLQEKRCGGQRSWTAMIYLNAVEEGGITEFNRLALSIPPCEGSLLLWNNACFDGSPNPWTMHAARPVVRGTKYVITKWFRTRTWQ